ncbi:acetyltransferase [Oceanicoccus sp. KOV_DT_Chl]|uniref:acetyltransferase n=1 Tax=Oceanicoccus sp. KOV_DT_Chl TaxID=1904639 RepID=UPI000C7E651D|nr:acetyltransferase [Oceanicoccus sp. KOV_DT_Chl]
MTKPEAKPIIVLGGGGHASVLIDILQQQGRALLGIADVGLMQGEAGPAGLIVLGGDDCVLGYEKDEVELVNGIGSMPGKNQRRQIYQRFVDLGYSFCSVIHPSAVVSPRAHITAGVQIMAAAVVQANAYIGQNSIINTRVCIDHDSVIGEHCHVAPGAVLCGGVTSGNQVHIGPGATIIQGVAIGDEAIVGAGAVLTKNLAARAILYPARGSVKQIGADNES